MMIENNGYLRRRILMISLLLTLSAGAAFAQTTSFTYQGRLTDGGTAANGSYDLQFTLWDALSGGTQQPQPTPVTVTRNAVGVANGIFTVQLDFGASAFPGADRYLEIGARTAGVGAFTILSPRQQITSTPYAVRSLNAAAADIATNATQLGGVAASQYVQTTDSRLSDSRAPTAGSANYIQNTVSPQAGGNFNISGNGTVGGRLSSASLGVGTNIPQTTLDVRGWLTLDPGADPLLFASSSGLEKNRYLRLVNSPDFEGASGLKAGGVLVSDDYGYANPGKNDLVVKGNVGIGVPKAVVAQLEVVDSCDFGIGVYGKSECGRGVYGSGSSVGVAGTSNAGYGISGITSTGIGVYATAASRGSAALRTTNGTSFFSGNTTPLPSDFGKGVGLGFDTTSNFGYIYAYDYSANQAQSLALNSSGGNVGIGTATPDRTLTVNGRARIASIPLSGGTEAGYVCFDPPGNLLNCGLSSLRYKTNVQPFSGGLDIIRRLRPISFNWKEGGKPDIGLGAEDVAEVAPSFTFTDSKGEVSGVKYDRLNIVLINAVKEQQKQIELQQKQIATLTTSNAALNARLQGVEKSLRKKAGSARRRR